LREGKTTVLLNRGLLDGVHLAFEVGNFIGLGTITLIKQQYRPENNGPNGGFDGVVFMGPVLLAVGSNGPLRNGLRFLLQLMYAGAISADLDAHPETAIAAAKNTADLPFMPCPLPPNHLFRQ
jgi:hypothetical protein